MSKFSLSAASAALLLAGCTMGTPYQRPAADLPAAWEVGADAALAADKFGTEWWKVYADPRLDRVVADALQYNSNLLLAMARVDEARAQLGVISSSESVGVGATFNRSRSQSSSTTGTLPPGSPRERNNYRAALNVSYELDLWGRLRSSTKAAQADLLATEAARNGVRNVLIADVVQTWFALRALDEQVAAAQRSIGTRGEGVALQKMRYDAGVISFFELSQLQSELSAAQAQLPALERSRQRAHTALAVLLGRTPKEIFEQRGPVASPTGADATSDKAVPVVVPAGLPSELLLRRPDLVQAEQGLIAANARIAAARASLFPAISLTGMLGSESAALGDLFTGPAGIWSLAAGIAQPIFQAGRLRAAVDAAESRERQAVLRYQQAIQGAFKDVRDAIDGQTLARQQLDAENSRVESLRDTYRLARMRYENGVASLLDVLDAERGLLAAELSRADALRAQRAAVADLFKALGGGWEPSTN
jgi:multidrug efflux system outer membrane protein